MSNSNSSHSEDVVDHSVGKNSSNSELKFLKHQCKNNLPNSNGTNTITMQKSKSGVCFDHECEKNNQDSTKSSIKPKSFGRHNNLQDRYHNRPKRDHSEEFIVNLRGPPKIALRRQHKNNMQTVSNSSIVKPFPRLRFTSSNQSSSQGLSSSRASSVSQDCGHCADDELEYIKWQQEKNISNPLIMHNGCLYYNKGWKNKDLHDSTSDTDEKYLTPTINSLNKLSITNNLQKTPPTVLEPCDDDVQPFQIDKKLSKCQKLKYQQPIDMDEEISSTSSSSISSATEMIIRKQEIKKRTHRTK